MESSVALVGFYGRDNFGDDLMAVIFGSHLKCLGVPFSGFNIDPEDAGEYALGAAASLEQTVDRRHRHVLERPAASAPHSGRLAAPAAHPPAGGLRLHPPGHDAEAIRQPNQAGPDHEGAQHKAESRGHLQRLAEAL